MNRKVILILAVGLLMFSGPLFAHHGAGNTDTTHLVTLKGVVTEFEMINPHVLISLDVKDDKGAVERWDIECPSLNTLHKAGWNRNTIKPGDQVSVMGYAAKNGAKLMIFRKIVLPDGKVLTTSSDQ